MATFEEIFDTITKERNLKRKKIEQFDKEKEGINRQIDIATRFIYSNISRVRAIRETKNFIKDNNLKEKIFNDFLEQVKIGKKCLCFYQTFGYYEIMCEEEVFNKVLIDVLQPELPSYDITINWEYDAELIEKNIGLQKGIVKAGGCLFEKGIFIEIIAQKSQNVSKEEKNKQSENFEEKIPFVHIETFNDDIRKRLANAITYFLEEIPEYDEDIINMLKEKEILIKYQPLIHGTIGEKSQNLEIVIQLQYNIDDGVILEIKHYFHEKDNGILLDREYEYYQENGKHYFKITREALEPLKKM